MDAIDSISRVVLGRHFASAVVTASGALALALLGAALGGVAVALPLGSGALTVGFADIPGPPALQLVELGFTAAATTVDYALVWACNGQPPLQLLVVPLLGFAGGMVALWGKRALAVSFSILFITVIALGLPPAPSPQAWIHGVALFAAGGAAYTAWAMLLGAALRARTRRLALADLFDALAAYRVWQAESWAAEQPHRGAALLEAANDALQVARDSVLRDTRNPHEAVDIHMLLQALDLFEAMLAAQTDMALLRDAFDGTGIIDQLCVGSRRSARSLRHLAGALRRGTATPPPTDPAPWRALATQAARLRRTHDTPRLRPAYAALRAQLQTQRAIDFAVRRLHTLHGGRDQAGEAPPAIADVAAFTSAWSYAPRQLLAHLDPASPILRHALRMALGFAAALLLARLLGRQSHDYWILLTIAVILRPNYGVTRQRLQDRLIGTLLGCGASALLLQLSPSTSVQLAVLVLAMAMARTFVTINYRFTAFAASVMALVLARLLHEGAHALIAQRLLDTAIGGALAWGCSYVLPRWEAHDLPRLLSALLQAQYAYAAATLAAHTGAELGFRMARKQLFDTLAGIGGSHARMLEEPSQQRSAQPALAELMQQGYLLGAHLASLRVARALLRRVPEARVESMMGPVRDWTLRCLDAEQPMPALPPAPPPATDDPLQRRLDQVTATAARSRRLVDELRALLPA